MKKVFTTLLVISFWAGASTISFSAENENVCKGKCCETLNAETVQNAFGSFTGTVKQITEGTDKNQRKIVNVQGKNGDEANIVISRCTYMINDEEIKTGDVITAFYDANALMILIYPPQYNAIAVATNKEGQNVKVDLFDEDLVSSDGMLKLNIGEKTEVILRNGRPFSGELGNKKLAVVYGAATKSIPALTTPSRIVVLCGGRRGCSCH